MSDRITLTLDDGRTVHYPFRTTLREILPAPCDPSGLPYIAALVDNDTCSLNHPLEMDCAIRLLTMANAEGWPVFQRTLCFILAKAVKELFPQAGFSVDYAIGNGLYCTFDPQAGLHDGGITAVQLDAIRSRMREIIARDLPIERKKVSFAEVSRLLAEAGQGDKLNLLRFRNPPRVLLHACDGFLDLWQGPLAPSTGTIHRFDLALRAPGFVLLFPDPRTGQTVPPPQDLPLLYQAFRERKEWGRTMGVGTVGRLNEIIVNGDISDFIKVAEALHEKNVARVADEIQRRGKIRIVLIAGPSSSGKTTFAKRLGIQLRVNGLRVSTISLDNYFVDLSRTPLDESGKPDFEHLNALNLELFNQHMNQLTRGEEVELPEFDFQAKVSTFKGNKIRLGPSDILVIEGIHGLNPDLTRMIPEEVKFKIYVSALTQLSLDANNRIATTDNRLIRRMVRDHKYRGHSALKTLSMWPSVRRGEERWIFPFQGQADATFNSALDYELAVLKPIAEPLLREVKPFDREYAEARRLTTFLLNLIGISDREVPNTSMLREYIGRSSFKY